MELMEVQVKRWKCYILADPTIEVPYYVLDYYFRKKILQELVKPEFLRR